MKAIINKEAKPGEYFFNLPLFESKPEAQVTFLPEKSIDHFVLHFDFEEEIAKIYPTSIKFYPLYNKFLNGYLIKEMSLDDDAIRSINNLYFELLDGNFAEGSIILNGIYLSYI